MDVTTCWFWKTLAVITIVIGINRPLQGATIVDFDFASAAGNTSHTTSYSVTSIKTIASNVSISAGVNIASRSIADPNNSSFSTTGGLTSNDFNVAHASIASGDTSFTGAVATGNFIAFTISPLAGYQLNLNNATVTFKAWRQSNASPINFALTASTTLAPSPLAKIGNAITPFTFNESSVSGSANAKLMIFTLPSTGYNAITGPIEFRLYDWGSTGNMHFQQATVADGTVSASPEPASLAVVGLAVMQLLRRHRN